ncbi:MAG TPA: YihY/virulence factor BrkB family protein [Acidobacteriaceae bacterium]
MAGFEVEIEGHELTGLYDLRAGLGATIIAMQAGKSTEEIHEAPAAVPLSEVRPVVRAQGLWPQVVALARYMVKTEVHTYAFSVAANVILSLFPFIVMMLTISSLVVDLKKVLPVVSEVMSVFLPSNQQFIMYNMGLLVHPHKSMQVYSIVMLLISSTGIFLPLEVALNGVWGVRENRSYLRNQLVSLGLAFAVGVLALISVALTAAQKMFLTRIFFGHVDNIFYRFFEGGTVRLCALCAGILIFFLIYWILPNRKIPARAVLPTAIVMGVLWEVSKSIYVMVLPRLDFRSVYGPFYVSVSLMIWAFLSGLLLLAGAHFSATRYALSAARKQEREDANAKEIEADAEHA